MINIKSDTDTNTLDIQISGYAPELIQEFGAIIRTVCNNFITKMPKSESRKEFASQIALRYVKEIRAAYRETLESDS